LVSPVSIIPPVPHAHVSVAGCTCCQQLAVHYAVHPHLNTEIMLAVLLCGQSKTSVIDIIDDDDNDGYLRT